MSKGENIFKRKDGRWEGRFIKGRDESGKIVYGFCYGKTYKEAKDKLEIKKAQWLLGMYNAETLGKKLSLYCDDWLTGSRYRLRESTLVKYHGIIENHIKPQFGNRYPSELTNSDISRFTERLMGEMNLSPKSVKDILTILNSILQHAKKDLPEGTPIINVPYPSVPKDEMRVLSKSEQEALVDVLTEDMDECRFGILLALLTGMRIGELCALRWKNVDLETGCIHIRSTMQRLVDNNEGGNRTKVVTGPPKSRNSVRTIPLTEYAVKLCSEMDPSNPDAYVLTGRKKFMEPRTVQNRLAKYTDMAGLKGVHFHTLRHTFATRAIEVGFDVKSLSEIMGHSSASITLEKYVHSDMRHKKSNMDKLSAAGM